MVGIAPDIPHHQPSSRTSPMADWPPNVRPLYGPREEETAFANGRISSLALWLLEGVRVRYGVVCASSALEDNDPC